MVPFEQGSGDCPRIRTGFIIRAEISIIAGIPLLAAAVFMQNLIVFCQRCLSWVEPHAELCPDCGTTMTLDQPDLEPDFLDRIIGTPLMLVGPVRVERPRLPNYGDLVGTSEGMMFLPRLHRRLNGAWEGVTSHRVPGWWPFRGEQSTNRFLDWLRRPANAQLAEPTQGEARFLTGSLSQRLMDSPGAFFIERRFIRAMTCRRKGVRLERSPYRSITLFDESPDMTLPAALELLETQAGRMEAHK